MAEIEYKKDLDVFKELYQGLKDRYKRISEELKIGYAYFEDEYLNEPNPIVMFINDRDTDWVRIHGDTMSHYLEHLCKMENDLNVFGSKTK